MVVVVAAATEVANEEAEAATVLRGLSARANPVMGRSLGAFACEEEEEGTRIAPERDATLALAVATPTTLRPPPPPTTPPSFRGGANALFR